MSDIDSILATSYFNPGNPGSLGGVEPLFREVRKYGITKSQIKKWLSRQDGYTLHKQIRRKFPRNKTWVPHQMFQFQADLADMRSLAKSNYGYKYILTIIDVLSRYAWGIAIKSKKPQEIVKSFSKVFSEQKPLYLQTDRGKEFVNTTVKNFLNKEKINFFTTRNQTIKCALVERFNRTLKNKIFRLMTSKNTKRWVPNLSAIVASYNATVHRSIKTTPTKAVNMSSDILFEMSYGRKLMNIRKNPTSDVTFGDKVRIGKHLGAFNRGYLPNWSEDTFYISGSNKGDQKDLFKVKNSEGQENLQRYYKEEIQKINSTPNKTFKIEKILAKKISNGCNWYKIKWIGFPSSYNKWIPESKITDYK